MTLDIRGDERPLEALARVYVRGRLEVAPRFARESAESVSFGVFGVERPSS